MAREIREAMVRMEERKIAAGIGGSFGQVCEEDITRATFSGLDLDVDEIYELQPLVAASFMGAVLQGLDPGLAAAGLYWDGIATGLLIAEQRAKARS